MRWQKKLTKAELAHIRKWCGGTLSAFKRNRKEQKKFPSAEPCLDCRIIAHKLNLEGT